MPKLSGDPLTILQREFKNTKLLVIDEKSMVSIMNFCEQKIIDFSLPSNFSMLKFKASTHLAIIFSLGWCHHVVSDRSEVERS